MVDTPSWLRQKINTVYPPSNFTEYERWFYDHYDKDVSGREYLPIFFCAYHVNNNYGNDANAIKKLQDYVDGLDEKRKYFCISQYDDGVLVDWKGKDVLEFNMSKNVGYPLPLIGESHPHAFDNKKEFIANFVGSKTHPIRNSIENLTGVKGYYLSYGGHGIDDYCRILAKSTFTLCFRGYGINSFRICEALQYGSIPVYISDEFIEPHNIPFEEYGVKIKAEHAQHIDEILRSLSPSEIEQRVRRGKEVYTDGFTYAGCRNKILQHLMYER